MCFIVYYYYITHGWVCQVKAEVFLKKVFLSIFYYILYYIFLLYSLYICVKTLYGIPNKEAMSDLELHTLLANFIQASLHTFGKVYHIGKLYNLPFVILEDISSLTAISSSSFSSEIVLRKSSFIRPSDLNSEIYELFLLF